ncbi:MAG: hypothetical protein WC806_00475 [Candidatus Gracilibacteria bacterium]|jgi:Tfp pilus assembly protein PilO
MINSNQLPEEIKTNNSFKSKPFIGAFAILLVVVIYALLLRPLSGELAALKADLTSKETVFNDLKTKVSTFDSAEKGDGLTEIKKMEISQKIPLGINQDEMIRDLINIAKNNDIEITSISFSKGISANPEIGTLKINSGFEGNYSDLLNFLKSIEQNSRFLNVNSISVQINVLDVTDLKRANFLLSIESYYQIEK